ncbi:TPA: hypothetical protein QCX24_003025 [Bacillus toyonensis]|uniref:hypothetical protein n=1 Tax=Bacillus cereus group TaxID=86661 RepID=UPI000BFC040F|nr:MULTISPECIES: hypothetical protein [Bacillus cereus group]PHA81591.1 hypothetical protein COE74_27865 [Bacillus toyonensis]QWI06076.1 hypothetical protein EXW54_15815 [Bacillus toyonensis]QWI46910.1 hypothetical protein EXW55_28995 [Bacillus mycoides]HDR7383804.1 hypothetical protein [Bacillus toyonensis]
MEKERYPFHNFKGEGGGSPYLLIPYFGSDIGIRPVPKSVTSYQCSGILINGLPYNQIPLSPDVELNLSVLVKNTGMLSTSAMVRIYWFYPTTTFTPASSNLIGQQPLYVPAGTTKESPAIQWIPKNSTPPVSSHVCLVAEVHSVADKAPGTFDVTNDRHYAQSNLSILLAKPGEKISFEFNVGNPKNEKNRFKLRVKQLHEETVKIYEKRYNAEAVHTDMERFYLRRVKPGLRQENTQELSFVLPSENQQLYQVMIDVPPDLNTNQFIAAQIEQIVNEQDKDLVIGTIGLIIFVKTML